VSFFILQVWVFLTMNRYILTKREMAQVLSNPLDRETLRLCLEWDNLESERRERPEAFFAQMVEWSSSMLLRADAFRVASP
jgi:hypothetical protein